MSGDITVNIKGLGEITTMLRELPEKIQKNAAKTALARSAKLVKESAERNIQQNFERRTGELLGSIKVRRGRDTQKGEERVVVYSTAFYSLFLEKGAMHRPRRSKQQLLDQIYIKGMKRRKNKKSGRIHLKPRPFLVPALEENKDIMIDEIKKNLQIVVEKQIAKQSK